MNLTCERGICAEQTIMGERSNMPEHAPVATFVNPGPKVAQHICGSLVSLPATSAITPATNSCLVK
ncbi:hypothetical protein CBM2586_A110081 [Cupriavidus phytorum]|uniref:Uncharacterized protein n=1 Tax=Cupriavidus taiwanensis TaxID=164546 RepID=A0A975X641_9BURK|nr:hypothetical protein CBM2586_A110081 [Cupriavidus taiwanensis]